MPVRELNESYDMQSRPCGMGTTALWPVIVQLTAWLWQRDLTVVDRPSHVSPPRHTVIVNSDSEIVKCSHITLHMVYAVDSSSAVWLVAVVKENPIFRWWSYTAIVIGPALHRCGEGPLVSLDGRP